jgi:hypothetical protein
MALGEGKGLCVGSGVPLAFGRCHAGILGGPLLRSMRGSSVERVVAMGWVLRRVSHPMPRNVTANLVFHLSER